DDDVRAGLERYGCACSGNAPVQLGDKRTVGGIMAFLLDHAAPRRGADLELGARRRPNLGKETVGLHADRPERQAQATNPLIGHTADVTSSAPLERRGSETELERSTQQRRLVGVDQIASRLGIATG